MLRAHVLKRSDQSTERGEHRPLSKIFARRFRHTEVDDFRYRTIIVQRDQYIARFYVAMDNPFLVRLLNGLTYRDDQFDPLANGKLVFIAELGDRHVGSAAMIAGLSVTSAHAQKVRDPVSRHQTAERGFFEGSRTSRHIDNARTYSSDVYRYARTPQPISPQVLRSESTPLGEGIAHSQREATNLGAVVKENAIQTDALKVLNGHLSAVAAKHKELSAEWLKDSPDPSKCAMCASQITKELDKAHAEHEAIMRELEIAEPVKQSRLLRPVHFKV